MSKLTNMIEYVTARDNHIVALRRLMKKTDRNQHRFTNVRNNVAGSLRRIRAERQKAIDTYAHEEPNK